MAKPSRRELLKLAALGAAGAAAGVASSQEKASATDLTPYEANLAKPLDATAKEKLTAAVEFANATRKARLAYKLPENSEPCTRYVPAGSDPK